MRTFYLFKIKNDLFRKYKYKYNELYDLFNEIYYMKSSDLKYAFELYDNLVENISRNDYSEYIKNINITNESYIRYNNIHTINDFYEEEATKMIINNSYIKIITNKNYPLFFNNFKNIRNIFVCDFDNNDYFILNDLLLA